MTINPIRQQSSEKEAMRLLVRTSVLAAPLTVLTARALLDLERECGAAHVAVAFFDLATEANRPIGIHSGETTTFLAPPDWTEQRLAGYVAGKHEELAAAFGDIEAVGQ
jgi:hypothetical protein